MLFSEVLFMELKANELVLFPNGEKAGVINGVQWNERHQAFRYCSSDLDEYGNRIIYYSTTIIQKPERKSRKKFTPSKESCTVQIWPLGETAKAYQIEDGSNGKIGRSSVKEYYKYIAKSICYTDENGNIFAPVWAMK